MHITEDELRSWGLHPSDQTDPRFLSLPAGTSDEEFMAILEEIAEYDDYAMEILLRARALGIGSPDTYTPGKGV